MTSIAIRAAVERSASLEHCIEHPPTALLEKLLAANLFTENPLHHLRAEAEEMMERTASSSTRILSLWDTDYPALLTNIAYPPALLFVRGTLQAADAVSIGVVGTRHCSQYGKLVTERFAECFAAAGCVVVSGLASGIDTIAHQATVKAGGITYAVIASGVDSISPYYARNLAEKIIAEGGAVISEYRLGVKALPTYFPQRNRIISGIARALVVVESGIKGGSLITAQFASDQSRELYAVPGNISSEKSEGTNRLIQRQLAIPALSPEQILEDLGIAYTHKEQSLPQFSSELEEKVYRALSSEPIQADTLAENLNINVNDLLVALLMLEFRGVVRQLAGKQFMRV